MSSEYIIGRNPVIEALRAGRDINKILVAEGAAKGQVQIVLALAKENKVILQHAPKKKLDQLVEGNHQGVIAQVAAYQYAELEDLFKLAEKRNEDPFFLILDEIEDPHNLGSIMRTADATGAHGVIIPKEELWGLQRQLRKRRLGQLNIFLLHV